MSTDVEPPRPQPPANLPIIITQPCGTDRAEPLQSVSLTVEAKGRQPLQYQWQKKRKDDPSSSETFQQKVFRTHAAFLKRFLDVSSLSSSLFQHGLVTSEQHEELIQEVPGSTNAWKVNLLLKWLPRSSSNFLEELIMCLREASSHRGHMELAETLEEELNSEQWEDVSPTDSRYEGVDGATLTISRAEKGDEGSYRCLVTNFEGSVFSQTAKISLIAENSAVKVLVAKLRAHPDKARELGSSFISKLEPKSTVGYRGLFTVAKMVPKSVEVIQEFLDAGWSPDFFLEDGKTLVHILAERGSTETLSLALQRGGDRAVTFTDKDDRTPLHLAAKAGCLDSVKMLLQQNTSCINYQDKDLNTALHLATMADNFEVLQTLLSARANPTVENKEHKRPLEVAREREHKEIIQALESTVFIYQGSAPDPLSLDSIRRAYSVSALPSGRFSRGTSGYESWEDVGSLTRGAPNLDLAIMEIQNQLLNYRGTLTGKKHLKSGLLKKCTKRGALEQRKFFLLSDVLLHTKSAVSLVGGTKYTVRDEMSVRGMEVLDPQPPAVRNQPHSFTIKSRQRALNVVASSAEEKSSWMEELQQAIDALSTHTNSDLPEGVGLGSKAPVMVPDIHVSMCQVCEAEFTTIVRRHHCRNCGKVVCAKCSPDKNIYLPYLKKKERVCKVCVEDAGAGRRQENEPECPQESGTSSKDTVICGYARRQGVGQMWHQLMTDNVLYLFNAHEDKTAVHSIPLLGYAVQGDASSFTIKLCHPQMREELNEVFKLDSFEDFQRWQECLKQRTRT